MSKRCNDLDRENGDYYRPHTKLREDTVFTHVCLFTGGCRYLWLPGPMFLLGGGVSAWFHVPSGGFLSRK